MAVDIFLDLDGVKGESRDSKHLETIDVLSWSWGLSQSGTAHMGGGAGAGKVSVQDISFTHYIDKASPTLMLFCCNGKHMKKGKLIVRKAGENPLEYLTIDLEDILVSHVSTGGSHGEDRLTENFTLNFAKFKLEYIPQTESGAGGKRTEAKWDIPANV